MAMPASSRPITVDEYERLVQTGVLQEDDRVELLGGEIVALSPIGPRHAAALEALTRWCYAHVADRAVIRVQDPIRLTEYASPQPDLALARPPAGRYLKRHPSPSDLLLAVEITDASQRTDREDKIPAYALAGVAETWIVDLLARQVEIYRDPTDHGYRARTAYGADEVIAPLAFPDASVAVSTILPIE